MMLRTIIILILASVVLNCKGTSIDQKTENSPLSYNSDENANTRFSYLNKLGIDSVLIIVNYQYGEIFLSASKSYSQNYRFSDYYSKYMIDDKDWKMLLTGINKFAIQKEPFVKRYRRHDGILVASDYKTLDIYIYIYI